MSNFKTVSQTAEILNLTPRRVRQMCAAGLIDGAVKAGPRAWLIKVWSDGTIRVKPGRRGPQATY